MSADDAAIEGGGVAPVDSSGKPDAEQQHEAATTPGAFPLAQQDADSNSADSSLVPSSLMNTATSSSSSENVSAGPRHAIELLEESSSDSQANPDGDPPYKRRQQTASPDKDGGGAMDSNDEEDMPALEAVNPDDGDDDDDTGDDHEVPWKPQATQSTCEFTHTITNYSQKRDSGCKKAEYSATTVDEFGNRWRLIVYVNGNGRASNHHLSLFLQVADADYLPFGWKKAVSYVLTLEHHGGANFSYAKRNPDKTFKLCPKAIDWGWSQFITSDRIQQEGFVQNDSLVVRASVTVKSSSVSIDLEDAELYLKCAVEEGKPEAVQLCLDQGASVNCQFKDDLYTPLHTACSTNTGEVDVDEDEDYDDDSDGSGVNKRGRVAPAANSGSMQVLRLLLEKGADGNACNKWRETPLLIAANNGHCAAVEALLNHGADPSLCSEAGWSALTFAAHKGYDDIVALLLEKGAPVNCRVTEDASTPLHKACAGSKSGHLAAATLLLANNADVHALNKWRETPLLTAANHGQAGTVDALLKAGADPCKCTDTGWSPLSIAAYKGHDDVVKLLLEEGAPTEEADPTLSALLQAATKGLPDTVELLLRHGADHTVTTKKGDTALSILVEQNLIDAAADMVTEYNASIPRCSRDRKKVQRARLLVNLKIKQRQREGRDVKTIDTDDDESDQELNIFAAAEDNPEIDESAAIEAISTKKNKNRNNKKKISAEQQAKAAEEALLAELEMEDAERQKQEDEANKKSAKKRKKKERERQLKKEQEQKLLEQENERQEKLRKEREAREAKERAERDRLAAIKLKEEEEERKRVIEQQKVELAKREEERKKEFEKWKQQQKQESSVAAKPKLPAQAATKTPKVQPVAVATPLTSRATNPSRAPQSTKAMQGRVVGSIAKPASKAAGKNRGWETKPLASQLVLGDEATQTPSKPFAAHSDLTAGPSNFLTPSRDISGQPESYRRSASSPFSSFGGEMMNPPAPGPLGFAKSEPILNGFSSNSPVLGKRVEVPAVALFRRSKVSELLQRIAAARMSGEALGTINEATIKKVLYRWMVRAAHETATHWDCIIPSWTDFEKLTAFFQRQFISESRKRFNSSLGSSTVGMESLKEAGTAIAVLCHGLAKEVSEFCSRVEEQLPHDWNDAIIGMKASDLVRNGSVHQVSVVVDWANRAQVFLPAFAFNKLQQRYVGIPGRLLSTIFSTQIRYETQQLVTADTMMDFRLSAETLAILTSKAQISGEVWSNPMTAASGSIYWGQFVDVDNAFGGLAPFSSEERSEEILSRHGGSVVVTVPLDSMIASMYLNRVLSLLDRAESGMVPLSFVIFLRSESFLDGPENPSFNDLCAVEPRLREHADYFSHIKELPSRQHGYFCTRNNRFEISETGSLVVVLQNASGRALYGISEMVMGELLRSMSADLELSQTSQDQRNLPLMSEMSFSAPEFVPASKINSVGDDSASNFFNHAPVHARTPISPVSAQPRNILPDFGAPIGGGDFGGFGVGSIGGAFGSAAGSRSSRPARGRLFDLVDDGAEDETADVVSGMLGNLNMDDLFSRQPNRNSMGEIDIEAISLMGIGGPVPSSSSSGGLQPRRGPFGY